MAARGRPRAFDREQALHRAMNLFWERGYEGTSIGDLTDAMGINKPSLYAAFGSKEALFREALALYDAIEGEPIQRALDQAPTARAAVESGAAPQRARLFRHGEAARLHDRAILPGRRRGERGGAPLPGRIAQAGRGGLRLRIERGITDGDVPAAADAATIAAFDTTVMHGLSVQARDGTPRATLDAIVDCALASWDALAGA